MDNHVAAVVLYVAHYNLVRTLLELRHCDKINRIEVKLDMGVLELSQNFGDGLVGQAAAVMG